MSTTSSSSTHQGQHHKGEPHPRTNGNAQHNGHHHVEHPIPNEADYYAVLGVGEKANAQEIKQEFRRLAKLWHPDHFTSATPDMQARAERRMQALNRAYDVLCDPVKRVAYDQRRLHSGRTEAAASAFTPSYNVSYMRTASHASADHYNPREYPPVNSANNPNGAGMVGAALCVVLALGVLRLMSVNGSVSGPGIILGFTAFIGLIVLIGYLVSDTSPIARAAHRFFEYDPRVNKRQRVVRPHQQYHPVHAVHAEPDGELEPTAFELLVDEALANIPEEFHKYLDNVVVRVKLDPTPEELERMKILPCSLLLGLYEGVPLIHQSAHGHTPEIITIFQHSIEHYCHDDPERIRHQVRATVFHELAHHFGIKHEDMPAWVK